jgi:RNA 2',3'-cyclic 3'-phosphodiesterase
MRLFIALDLDSAGQSAIAAEQKRLRAALHDRGAAITWVRPEQMHLTLVFLGEVDESRATPLVESAGRDVQQRPFDLVFGGLGVFPSRGSPNVLWLGVTSGAERAVALQHTLAERVKSHGVPLEARPFSPHLTLARWRASRSADRHRVTATDHGHPIVTLHVDHATLYQSRLSPAGSSYTPLARATLCSA